MKKLLLSVLATALTVFGLGAVASLSPAYAVDGQGSMYCISNGQWMTDMTECPDYANQNNKSNLMETVNTIINVIIGIVGFVAVAMMIVGGINFITSQGDTGKVTKARNTILYGVVGLVVAILAFAIVNFVLSSVFTSGGGA